MLILDPKNVFLIFRNFKSPKSSLFFRLAVAILWNKNMSNACSVFCPKIEMPALDLEPFSLDSDKLGKFPLELSTIVYVISYMIITMLLYRRFEPILIYFIVRLCSALACRIDLLFLFEPNQGENVIV